MSTWPATLPQKPQAQGFSEETPALTVRTEMDAGAAKVRRRFTAGVRNLNMTFELDNAQVATFDTFYTDTIKSGALPFDFPDPRTGNTVKVRMVNQPNYQSLGGLHFTVNLKMEILP